MELAETECADTFNISFSALFSLVRRFFLALRLIFDAFNFAFSNAFDFKLVETFAVELPLALCLYAQLCHLCQKPNPSCSNNESTVTFVSSNSLLVIDFFLSILRQFSFFTFKSRVQTLLTFWAAWVSF